MEKKEKLHTEEQRITADFLSKTLQDRRQWRNVFQGLKRKKILSTIL